MLSSKHLHPDHSSLADVDSDSNSALADLDKGLRSIKSGEQCEAIVKFPALFEKYPFPILVNASFLKLAEVFRNGTNFLRLWILRVCQQSEHHIKKIQNVDEFVRRVFSVIHSNDPVARALTLRVLAAVAPIISEHAGVHHAVRTSLDSYDAVELKASISAAEAFASKSDSFATQLFDKIVEKIRSLSCPVETKIQLLPILKHMGSDAAIASRVRQMCEELLQKNFPQAVNIETLKTLTILAEQTTIQVEDQVNLLLSRLTTDPNRNVRLHCLKDLRTLAKKGRLWNRNQVNGLMGILSTDATLAEESLVLEVLSDLVTNDGVHSFELSADSPIHVLWKKYCFSHNLKVASAAIRLLAHLAAVQSRAEGDPVDLIQETNRALESLFLSVSCVEQADTPVGRKLIRRTLCATAELGRVSKETCSLLAEGLGNRISDLSLGHTLSSVCEALSFLGDKHQLCLAPILPKVNLCISRFICDLVEGEEKKKLKDQVIVQLCVLLCLAHHGHSWQPESLSTLRLAALHGSYWTTYRVARACARYGHAQIGLEIMSPLYQLVSTESRGEYIQGCIELLRSESVLMSQDSSLMDLSTATDHCERGVSHLKLVADQGMTISFVFHCDFMKARAKFLAACGQLVAALKTLKTAPPPAVALGSGGSYKDDLLRCGRAASQLKNSADELRSVATQFKSLYEASFDADSDTLAHLLIYQHYCLLLAKGIEGTALRTPQQGMLYEDESAFDFSPDLPRPLSCCCLEIRKAFEVGVKVSQVLRTLAAKADLKPVSHVHVEGIMSAMQLVLFSPYCVPRFFFQSLQSTSVKLAISPSSRIGNEPIQIPAVSLFTMTVEGVIQSKGIRRCRSIKMVRIAVTNQPPVHKAVSDTKGNEDTTHLSQLVQPDNDYFSSEFILSLLTPGIHHLTIQTSLIDEEDEVWRTGPSFQLSVKSQEDPTKAHARQAGATSHSRP